MKRGILRHKFALWLITALALASCSQDDPMGDNGTSLPERVYPLEIASVTLDVEGSAQPWGADAPQTRVSENETGTGSVWNKDDRITVQIGDGEPGIYTMDDNGSFTAETPAYWQSSANNQTITAWYPEGKSIDLTDQSNGLAYVLQATTQANFNTEVSLPFEHSLSKIRVKLKGEKAGDVTSVQVKSYTQCTHDKGTVSGSSENWITMKECTYEDGKCWEANVVPEFEVKEIQLNGSTPCTFTSFKSEVRNVHEITITVNKKIPEITGGEITKPGDYIMKGNITESITLNASGINLTLDNVQSKTDGAPLIIGNNAQVTLNISGTANSLTSTNGNGIEIRDGASLTITGNGMNSSKLVVNASDNTNPNTDLKAGIGPSTGNVSIKTINISNVHLVVSGGRTGNNGNGPAAIGLCSVNGTYDQSCEGISITNSKIEATSYGGACIGTGSVSNDIYTGGTYNLGPITITSSQIIATANSDSGWGHSGACIGFGYIGSDAHGVIENITITKSTLDLTVGNINAYKIGRGDIENNATYSITNGIIVDGSNKGNEGWNPE